MPSVRDPAVLFAAALALTLSVGSAAAEDWKIARMSGQVSVTGLAMQPVALGEEKIVRPGQTITTGNNGRVLLVNGKDTVNIGPGSVVAVPQAPSLGVGRVLVQTAGVMDLAIDKQATPHFAVQTPYLAAVVKGTQFSVNVSERSATVALHEGAVEVSNPATGQVTMLRPGQVATVEAGGGGGIVVAGANATDNTQQIFGIALSFALGLGLFVAVRAGRARTASDGTPSRG